MKSLFFWLDPVLVPAHEKLRYECAMCPHRPDCPSLCCSGLGSHGPASTNEQHCRKPKNVYKVSSNPIGESPEIFIVLPLYSQKSKWLKIASRGVRIIDFGPQIVQQIIRKLQILNKTAESERKQKISAEYTQIQ